MSLVEKLIDPVSTLLDKFIPDADKKAQLAHDIATLADKQTHEEVLAQIGQARAVIEAEAKSGHWVTSSWRPITMLVFVAIVANNYLLYPYISLFWQSAPLLEVPQDLWGLIKIGLGGYVVGRSGEKMVQAYKNG